MLRLFVVPIARVKSVDGDTESEESTNESDSSGESDSDDNISVCAQLLRDRAIQRIQVSEDVTDDAGFPLCSFINIEFYF